MNNNNLKVTRRHPGRFVQKNIESMDMSNKEFSLRSGLSERTLSDLVSEKGNITFTVAVKLAQFFNTSIEFWLNMQSEYDEYLINEKIKKEIDEDFNCLKPYKQYLVDNNLINKDDDKETIVSKVRKALAINRLSTLNDCNLVVSYKEQKNQSINDSFAQNFLVSYALTEARKIDTKPYNKMRLLSKTQELKMLTKQKPDTFMPELKRILSDCGVSFVYIPYLKKSNIYGVTKWLNSGKAMLAISNRSERADMFWFTFFHELAHVLAEHKRYFLLQTSNIDDTEADLIAKSILINNNNWKIFIDKKDFSIRAIEEFAKKENILPMIVVGRLQKENYLGYGDQYKALYLSYQL